MSARTYKRPYDPKRPVVCMDEMSRQLLGHTRDPIEAEPGRPCRQDHHYERNGMVNLPAFFEPLAAHRVVLTRDRRTITDGSLRLKRRTSSSTSQPSVQLRRAMR
jgi:hypothetical protein